MAIETSSPVCGVSLHDAEGCLAENYLEQERVHAEKLAGLTAEILEAQTIRIPQLDAVVVSAGPGSFTGLRIGMSFAKGLVFPHRIPLAALNTMQAYIAGTGDLSEAPEHTVWMIRSHRDFYYMAKKTENIKDTKIVYGKIGSLRQHFPGCMHIICNAEIPVPGSGITQSRSAILPSMIGNYYLNHAQGSAVTDYDRVLLDYGMDYKPKEWEGGVGQ